MSRPVASHNRNWLCHLRDRTHASPVAGVGRSGIVLVADAQEEKEEEMNAIWNERMLKTTTPASFRFQMFFRLGDVSRKGSYLFLKKKYHGRSYCFEKRTFQRKGENMQISYNDGEYNYITCKKCKGKTEECDECENGLVCLPHECPYPDCEQAFLTERVQRRHMRMKHMILIFSDCIH
jgi:hypothetical protein